MKKEEFIKKWNVAFEDKEQEAEFAAEMNEDLNKVSMAITNDTILNICVLKENGQILIGSQFNLYEIIGHLEMIQMEVRRRILTSNPETT